MTRDPSAHTGQADAARPATVRRPWLAPLALAALLGGLLFAGLGQNMPLRSHEALLAETARNTYLDRPVQLADGSRPSAWLVPNFNDVPRLRKTPLPYWAVAGLAYLTGAVDEWTARLPSALAALGTALITLALVRRWDGRLASMVAAAALVTSAEFLIVARSALSDMPMTFFCTASLAAVWMAVETGGARRFAWLLVTGAAAGLAMLAKGPVPALVLTLPCIVAAVIMIARLVRKNALPGAPGAGGMPRPAVAWACSADAQAHAHANGGVGMPPGEVGAPPPSCRAEWAWMLGGAAVSTLLFFAILLPWPVYVWLHVPQALDIWRAESVDRSTGEYGHQEAIYFYVIRLPFLIAPWTVFFIHGLVLATRRAWREPRERAPLLFLGAWFLGTLAAFSIASGKQDHYILPLLPACAAYIAISLRHWLEPATPQVARRAREMFIGHAGMMAALGVLGLSMLGAMMYVDEWAKYKMTQTLVKAGILKPLAGIALLVFVGGGFVSRFAVKGRLHRSLAALVATIAAAFLLAMPTIIGPLDRATIAADFGRQVRREVPADVPLFSFIDTNNTVIYYAERAIPILPAATSVQEEVSRGRPFYLICHDKQVPLLPQSAALAPVAHREDPLRTGEGFRLLKAGAATK